MSVNTPTVDSHGTMARRGSLLRSYLQAVRPSHWLKNALVFLPLIAAHRLYELGLLAKCLVAFVAFTFCAGSVYLFNDLRDLNADRRDPQRRLRPLASGRIGVTGSLVGAAVLLVAALSVGYTLRPAFMAVIGSYYIAMVIYSLGAKSIAILDVLLLAGGYASRVVAGSVAAGLAWSAWLSAFCVFLFFSLALIKRYAELTKAQSMPGADQRVRGYLAPDGVVLVAQGMAAGYLSVLILALYTNTRMVQAPAGKYELFWVICLVLLYWISHMWLMAHRGRIQADPVVYALNDPTSRILVGIAAVTVLLAI